MIYNIFSIQLKMEKNIKSLPLDICNIILDYINIDYIFDVDSVYLYLQCQIFMNKDDSLNINTSLWYGVQHPTKFSHHKVLHTCFGRPYSIRLERSFRNISKIMCKNLKKFKLKDDIIDSMYGDIYFAGTYGPLRNNIIGRHSNCYFNKLSHCFFTNEINSNELLNYFKQIHILSEDEIEITPFMLNYCICNLQEIINITMIKSIEQYKTTTKNIVNGPFTNLNYSNKFFYKLSKPKKNNKKVIKKNIIKIINNLKY